MLTDYSKRFLCWWNETTRIKRIVVRKILLATFSMASEGMDIPKLDTVILASPKRCRTIRW